MRIYSKTVVLYNTFIGGVRYEKMVVLLITVAILLSSAGCGKQKKASARQPKRDYSEFAGIVEDTKSWYDELMAMPIASADMSEDQLRKLAADAFRINLSFTWTPTTDISYEFTLLERTSTVEIPAGMAYAGMFYNNNNARGNIWKVLLSHYPAPTSRPDMFSAAFGSAAGELDLKPLANGKNTIHIYARLSNGELLEVYRTVLKVD